MATSTISRQYGYFVKEGVTVYRQGKLRIVRLDKPSDWCATLYPEDRPSIAARTPGAVYNGSSYVECNVSVYSDGKVRVLDYYGNPISGAQYGYLTPTFITYFVD